MKIIDFKKKGNVVRFYLGADDLTDWWGDDWNDTPYEYNAGTVYDEFVKGYRDVVFPFDDLVIEPCEGTINSEWCKDDMKDRKAPCVIVVPKAIADDSWYEQDFKRWVGHAGVRKFYFGDKMEPEVGVNADDA